MDLRGWNYRYVGPAELCGLVRPEHEGRRIRSAAEFGEWASGPAAADLSEPVTFVVDRGGVLRLAPRRSEHVVCAGGDTVLSAGEIAFGREAGRWAVRAVSNQSTGYCPDPVSWRAVADALDAAGLAPRPGGFTHEVVFRRCPSCAQLNIVRDEYFVCVFCDASLPPSWNVDPSAG
ncbi:hypothetical protein DEJ51_04385 [Streptomyces venezuelae]|uniref:Uncharacterized protein n=1 Tax=Streptomyces venezuelae TaxID=54571 RepID=A0A5P2DEI7_STRVZ|nr:hypothetical protein [Streptomyces venezuelae]QES53584.1 hypothetical protein DEJ51_04385 [Streptomyces venezuelae]